MFNSSNNMPPSSPAFTPSFIWAKNVRLGHEHGNVIKKTDHLTLQAGIEQVGSQTVQIACHCPNSGTDRHLVVIEHDGEVAQFTRVVEASNDSRKGSIADDRNGVTFALAAKNISTPQSDSGTDMQPACPVMNRS